MKAPENMGATSMRMTTKEWKALNPPGTDLTIVRASWDGMTGDVVAVVWDDHAGLEHELAKLFAASPKLLAVARWVVAGDDAGPVERARMRRAARQALDGLERLKGPVP